ncbi:Metallo-beta-lactamase superfamily protein [Solimonas aquatica]|uniref:Metallo-beta-lactamase superfamily protein n=1 Tax=Solimonas aquatica TaxID=489703 RepID=A0A1H9IKH3_9GAMM|nr:MBL fold metallo-hydrolase [Solimonas aquatica]SEQ74982.1 Metallo-beta-lactamase superfamily protein [Solimonas aquatica]
MNPQDLPRIAPAQKLEHGIWCIDTLQDRPQMACCYLLQRNGELAFIEAGTSHGVPRLLALLENLGLSRERVRYVIPTHVHLDHAGGVGTLMRELPNAQLVAHPRGARHLIDPSKLIAGAQAVYGEAELARMYGEIAPVPEARVIVAQDDLKLDLGGAALQFIDTPGHARHHFSVWDEVSQGFFTGDTFGLSYREFDTAAGPFLMPTSSPVQFEPDAWRKTLDRYLSFAPQLMYLTHYNAVCNVAPLAQWLRRGIGDYERIARELAGAPQRHERLLDAMYAYTYAELDAHGCKLPRETQRALLAMDMELNAQGLGIWLDQQAA